MSSFQMQLSNLFSIGKFINIAQIQFRGVVLIACALYLVVAFKDPGYVDGYQPREIGDLEKDIEKQLSKQQNTQKVVQTKQGKHQKKKVKLKHCCQIYFQSVLSQSKSRVSRQDRLQEQINSQQTQQTQSVNTQSNQYQAISHMDQSLRNTPKSQIGAQKHLFSNTTTSGQETVSNNQQIELISINLDDSQCYASTKQLKDKKQIKVIAQVQKDSEQFNNEQVALVYKQKDHKEQQQQQQQQEQVIDQRNLQSPFSLIAKKIAQKANEGVGVTSEGDLAGKTTTANSYIQKTLLDKGAMKSDEFSAQTAIMISEEEINKRRKRFKNLNVFDQEIEDLDNSHDNIQQQQLGHLQGQFDAIQEEIEEELQKDDDEEQKQNQYIKNEANGDSTGSQTPSMFYVEQKYCTVCNIDMPLRTKHCKNCDKCVATYDHHCPWIGNCVAEKNRRFFFYFLLAQFTETIWSLIYIVKSFQLNQQSWDDWLKINGITVVALLIDVFFIFMVGSLVFIHLFLASNNLTTWECLSWNKISYLKIWPKKYGSPFSQGKSKMQNLINYFCPQNSQRKYFINWQMPKSLPDLGELRQSKGLFNIFRK